MKPKRVVLLAMITCAFLFLSAAKPKLIGEEEAKKIGLAFINHVFDVNETEATVTYTTQAGASYIDGENVETGKKQPVYKYTVSVSEFDDGRYRYRAQVNAETGVAYSASRSNSLVPEMTAEQRKAVKEAKGNGVWENYDFARVSTECADAAREWIPEKFDLKAKILGFIDCGFISGDAGAKANFYVVVRDGTIYYLDMAWPQLTVLEVGILNQTRSYADEP